ncbi:MAG: hypothetical protein M3162_01695 [Thermoproteota archaeon]|nr:hypothetical protein [Thermoproteota archaeon]
MRNKVSLIAMAMIVFSGLILSIFATPIVTHSAFAICKELAGRNTVCIEKHISSSNTYSTNSQTNDELDTSINTMYEEIPDELLSCFGLSCQSTEDSLPEIDIDDEDILLDTIG